MRKGRASTHKQDIYSTENLKATSMRTFKIAKLKFLNEILQGLKVDLKR